MQRWKFPREFKVGAVRPIRERGVSAAQAARDLDVHENVLRKWVRELACDPKQAFSRPWPDEAGAAQIGANAARGGKAQDGARHPKKGRILLREWVDIKFVFIAKHRGIWPPAWLCEALRVSRSGLQAWRTRSPSERAHPDEIVTDKMRASFMGSGRTYGARRVWHDLLAEGVSCGLHRKLPAFPPQPESDHPVRSCSTD